MLIQSFQDSIKLPSLGFVCMRLPLTADQQMDQAHVQQMVDAAMAAGANYFDTAYPYHGGLSELAIGKALQKYPRESYFLADKYPGHQPTSRYNPAEVFEDQLKKCGVEYFDFYLLHNVYENSIGVYLDPQWNIIPYFLEQRRLGRIKHLGFSTHARTENLSTILDQLGSGMEFCQIQLNYLDWTLQDAKAKYELLTERGIPVWVMEPLRGGKLANLSEADTALLHSLRPEESPAAWAFRWLLELPNVQVILSGMSSFPQMEDNLKTFSAQRPLSKEESELLLRLAEGMKGALPCTRCRYCTAGCPMGLDIPMLIHAYNDYRFASSMTVPMQFDALRPEELPSACIGCGACAAICPQQIDIPSVMTEFAEMVRHFPSWAEISRQREEAAKKLKAAK